MDDIEFRLDGVARLQARLSGLVADLRDNKEAARSVEEFLLRTARRAAPVLSGKLRRSALRAVRLPPSSPVG